MGFDVLISFDDGKHKLFRETRVQCSCLAFELSDGMHVMIVATPHQAISLEYVVRDAAFRLGRTRANDRASA